MTDFLTLNNLEKEFKEVGKAVKYLLENDERSRNEDKWLQLIYVRGVQGINLVMPFNDWERMISFETIARCRRKIQEEAMTILNNPLMSEERKNEAVKLLPTDPRTWRIRRLRADLIRKFMPKWKPLGE
jgi:hypothetical protein